jgi:hypothetical protein
LRRGCCQKRMTIRQQYCGKPPGLLKQNDKNQSDVIMKGKKSKLSLAVLALLAICGRIPVALATPIIVDELNYQGAVFTLGGEWKRAGSIYTMTYTAQFDDFQDADDQSYLTAIDWKWEGAKIDTVSLLEAPGAGGTGDWTVQTSSQIGGDAGKCLDTGDSNAVCTDFNGLGLSTAQDGLLSWVFEIHFRELNLQQSFLQGGVRSAYVSAGSLAAPDLLFIAPLSEGANVPVPGVPALLLIGLAGLSLCRAGGSKVART